MATSSWGLAGWGGAEVAWWVVEDTTGADSECQCKCVQVGRRGALFFGGEASSSSSSSNSTTTTTTQKTRGDGDDGDTARRWADADAPAMAGSALLLIYLTRRARSGEFHVLHLLHPLSSAAAVAAAAAAPPPPPGQRALHGCSRHSGPDGS